MKSKKLTKYIFLLGLGASMSTFANTESAPFNGVNIQANSSACYQLYRQCRAGISSSCIRYTRQCR